MKLLENVWTRVVDASPRVTQLVKTVEVCVTSIEKLAVNVAIIARNQMVHHQMISQMWALHEEIAKRAAQSGIDLSVPDIDKVDPDKDKPN